MLSRTISFLRENWAVLIATTSFIVAAMTLYYAHWKPFSPNIYSAGRYSLSINNFNFRQVAIGLDLIFSNRGARSGTIEDIYIKIHTPVTEKPMIPIMVFLERELNLTKNKNKTVKAEAFSAFEVKARESLSKRIVFVPYSRDSFELQRGVYRIDIYSKTSSAKNDTLVDSIDIEVEQADLDAMKLPSTIPDKGTLLQVNFQEKVTKKLDEKYRNLK